jgi:dihydrofolate reductase
MIISLIVAMGANRVIGKHNQIPWHLPADLKYFRKMTMGKPIIMGRKTYDSIGRSLSGRQNIVVTRNKDFVASGCSVVHSIGEALEVAEGEEVMIIGGAQLYKQLLPRATRLYLTKIEADFSGDKCFPTISDEEWLETSRHSYEADDTYPYRYHFIVLERRD